VLKRVHLLKCDWRPITLYGWSRFGMDRSHEPCGRGGGYDQQEIAMIKCAKRHVGPKKEAASVSWFCRSADGQAALKGGRWNGAESTATLSAVLIAGEIAPKLVLSW